jgi:hypothetical protein
VLTAGFITQIIMATIYTTKRCITVKETYEEVVSLINSDYIFIEMIEVISNYSEFPQITREDIERKILIQKEYIVEVNV